MNTITGYITAIYSVIVIIVFVFVARHKITIFSYRVMIAYSILIASLLMLLISLLIFIFMIVDIIFKIGFGYPSWSIIFGFLLVVIGFAMTKFGVFLVRRARKP